MMIVGWSLPTEMVLYTLPIPSWVSAPAWLRSVELQNEFPAVAANKMLNGKDFPKVTKAIRIKQDELAEKYAITPQKTGTMLWKITETAYETGQLNAAVSAIKELNQLAGLSVNRTQSLNINASLDKMSKDDIKERLNKLMGVDTTYDTKDM